MKAVSAFCLAVVLTSAVAIAYAIIVGTAYSAWEDSRFRRSAAEPSPRRYESLRVSSDGQMMIRVARDSHWRRDNPDDQFLDINRNPVPAPPPEDRLLPASIRAAGDGLTFSGMGPERRVLPIRQDPIGSFDWYFVFEDWAGGHARFEVYDVGKRSLIGHLGPTGFQETRPEETEMFVIDGAEMANHYGGLLVTWDTFQQNYNNYDHHDRSTIRVDRGYPISQDQVVLPAIGSLFLIDLGQRTVEPLLPEETVLSATVASRLETLADGLQPRGPNEEDDTLLLRQFLVVRTQERLVLLHPNDGTRSDLSIPPNLADQPFELYLTSDGEAILASYNLERSKQVGPYTIAFQRDIWWTTPNGDVTRQATVTLHQPGRVVGLDAILPLILPAPLLSLGACGMLVPAVDRLTAREPFAVIAWRYLVATWPLQLFVVLLAGGLAYAAYRHRAAHRLPRSWGWIAFVFLFGLPGIVGYLLHCRWPVRHPVPPPKLSGAEVFA